MSSSEDEDIRPKEIRENEGERKKRPRACDLCRRKKGASMLVISDHMHDFCTHANQAMGQKRQVMNVRVASRPKFHAHTLKNLRKYIASLEDRITDLHEVLRQLCPDDKLYDEWIKSLTGSTVNKLTDPSHLVRDSSTSSDPGREVLEEWAYAIRSANDDVAPPQQDDEPPVVASSLDTNRFFGKSSGEMLIREALSMKTKLVGEEQHPQQMLRNRREEFWVLRPWERRFETGPPRRYTFPEPDLAKDLLNLFFEGLNLHLPLLHRPSFERSVRDGLHYTNEGFAAVYLLVCAVGARFSNDPRVRVDGVESYLSAGWKWFNQVEIGKTSLLSLPSLYDLQQSCLVVLFLQCSSAPQAVWTMVGIALRLAQDVGVHRRRSSRPTAENELWKRAFWFLICIDRLVSVSVGRPCAIQENDFDLDMPVECDDEYWEHPDPEQRFKQPPNKPCTITGFVLFLRLMHIMSCCIRGIYSLNKTNEWFGLVGQQWKSRIVMELDSSLNKWLNSVPDYLTWDPDRKNIKHFNISAELHATYHHIRILIHRPFISSRSKPSPFPFPSLSICTHSARACVRIADAQRRRYTAVGPPPPVQIAVFTSGVVLLLNMWIGRHPGSSPQQNADDMIYLSQALEALKKSEERWQQAGKFWDLLSELSAMGESSHLRQEAHLAPDVQASTLSHESVGALQAEETSPPLSPPGHMVPNNEGPRAYMTTDEGVSLSDPSYRDEQDAAAATFNRLSDPSYDFSSLELPQQKAEPYESVSVLEPLPQVAQGSVQGGAFVPPTFPSFDSSLGTLESSIVQDSDTSDDFMAFLRSSARPTDQLYPESFARQGFAGDTTGMWSNAPTGFGLDDWDIYLTTVNESSREQSSSRSTPGS
ncbi:hypothetical protein NLJ89_g10571 [Agrocybe chaxingu]|uniref:Xylanolytic transcriptional activator regulatory domain-containing protein n=1 Tax=Agrocybe chaxingu TaxID=84603 RepID=A0A9W8MQS9_9AGAR|nr:hypothetical protein NLJ89_g10571 [Agrocybe chaxingu]